MTPLRVAVVGAGGRMGAEVCRAVAAASDLALVAAVDPAAAGQPLAAVAGLDPGREPAGRETAGRETAGHEPAGRETAGPERDGVTVAGDLEAVAAAGAEVVVDFTVAAAARRTLAWCGERRLHAVVGTTGLDDDDVERLRALYPDGGPAGCVLAANFALGAVLMMRFAELAAPWYDTAEIVELHHDAKRDAPSGTALHTARRMDRARAAAAAGPWAPDPTTTETVPGARGATGPGGLHVHSVRLQGLVAHQEVLLGGPGEGLTLRHDSFRRSSFMPGVLLAVRGVGRRPGLTVGLDALLGI